MAPLSPSVAPLTPLRPHRTPHPTARPPHRTAPQRTGPDRTGPLFWFGRGQLVVGGGEDFGQILASDLDRWRLEHPQ